MQAKWVSEKEKKASVRRVIGSKYRDIYFTLFFGWILRTKGREKKGKKRTEFGQRDSQHSKK
jgi:hypothetical protein